MTIGLAAALAPFAPPVTEPLFGSLREARTRNSAYQHRYSVRSCQPFAGQIRIGSVIRIATPMMTPMMAIRIAALRILGFSSLPATPAKNNTVANSTAVST